MVVVGKAAVAGGIENFLKLWMTDGWGGWEQIKTYGRIRVWRLAERSKRDEAVEER